MDISEKEYPLVLQAFETSGDHDQFVAEQVVHNQFEADNFATRCTGLLIKATQLISLESPKGRGYTKAPGRPRRGSATLIIIVLLLVGLVIAGFTTGWVQRTFDWPV
jgi:hypothetical protein